MGSTRVLVRRSGGSSPPSPVVVTSACGANIRSCQGDAVTAKRRPAPRSQRHAPSARPSGVSACDRPVATTARCGSWPSASAFPPTTSIPMPCSARSSASSAAHPARPDPRARIHLQPAGPQAPPLRRGPQAARLRALRPGRAVARPADVADPRPHQRRGDRQPPREPADRVPELRRDAGHALRQGPAPPAHRASVRRVRRAVRGGEPRAALLLARVLRAGPKPAFPSPTAG